MFPHGLNVDSQSWDDNQQLLGRGVIKEPYNTEQLAEFNKVWLDYIAQIDSQSKADLQFVNTRSDNQAS